MDDEKDRTLWVGGLTSQVTEELLYELFLQLGPLENITLAKDKDGRPRKFAFVTFKHAASVPYSIKVLEGTQLFHSYLKLQTRSGSSHDMQPNAREQNVPSFHRSNTWHGEPSREREQTWNLQSGQPIPFSIQGQSSPLTISPLAIDSSMMPKKSSKERKEDDERWIDQPLQNPYANDGGTLFSRRHRVMQQQNIAIDSHRERGHDRDRHQGSRYNDQSGRYNDRRQQSWKSNQNPYSRRY